MTGLSTRPSNCSTKLAPPKSRLDFPVVYASGSQIAAGKNTDRGRTGTLEPLFNRAGKIPAPHPTTRHQLQPANFALTTTATPVAWHRAHPCGTMKPGAQ